MMDKLQGGGLPQREILIQQKIDALDDMIAVLEKHRLVNTDTQQLQEVRDQLIAKTDQMRNAQISYFRTRNKKVLERSKMLEAQVDQLLAKLRAPKML